MGRTPIDDHLDEVIARYQSGHSLSQLGEEYGVSPTTVRKRLLNNGIEIRSTPHRYDWLDDRIDEIVNRYVEQEETLREIADDFDVSNDTIRRRLVEEDIDRRPDQYTIDECAFTQEQISVVKGELLGDGCLYQRPTGSYVFRLENTVKAHPEYVKAVLPDGLFSDAHPYRNDRTGGFGNPDRSRTMWIIYSRSQHRFAELASDWYECVDGKRRKRVPEGFELNEIALLHWYWGDGSISTRRGGAPRFSLSTQGFSKASVDRLLVQLEQFGYEPYTLQQKSVDNGSGLEIRLGGDSARQFLADMAPRNEIDEYRYKFTTETPTNTGDFA